jgi:hypothetical protein
MFRRSCTHYSPSSPEKRELKIVVENNAHEFFQVAQMFHLFLVFSLIYSNRIVTPYGLPPESLSVLPTMPCQA